MTRRSGTRCRSGDGLQWGHGSEAVDDAAQGAAGDGGQSRFNGATARKPWMTPRGTSISHRRRSFNGATARKPWMTRRAITSRSSVSALQWGHGSEAVDDADGSVSYRPWAAGFNGATARKPWMTPRSR